MLKIIEENIEKKKTQFLLLFFAILILYTRTIYFDYNLDDYIINDALDGKVNHFKDLFSLLKLSYNNADYRPIVFISYGLEKLVFGEYNAGISHAINCILYFFICISGLNLFSILFDKKYNIVFFFAVLLFCVHPLNTEVVCSIKCRDNLLSMLFGLVSSILFIQFLQEKSYKWLRFLLFLLLSLVALLSKADAIGFLFFNVAYVVFSKKENKIKFIFFAFLSLILVSVLLSTFQNSMLLSDASNEFKGKVTFTENPLAIDFTLPNRIISFANTVSFYFVKLIPISGFKYYYGYHQLDVLSVNSISFYVGLSIIITLILLLIFAIKNKNSLLILSISGIFLTSIYALNFFTPVAGIIADRYIFMSSLFFCLLVATITQTTLNKIKFSNYFLPITIAFFFIFSVMSINRIGAWKNFRTLIDTDAPGLYNSYEAMRIAASVYFEEYKKTAQLSDLNKAIYYAEKGNKVYPKNSLLHLLAGQYYFKKSDYNNAIQNFIIATKNDTTQNESLVFLGDIYYINKQLDSALYFYKIALNKVPKSAQIINNISTIYFEKNEKEKCLAFNYNVIKADSTIFATYENLGYYYLAEKDTTQAKYYFNNAVKKGMNQKGLPPFMQ